MPRLSLQHSYHSIEQVHFFINNGAILSINDLNQPVQDTVGITFYRNIKDKVLPHFEVECPAQVSHRMVIAASPNFGLVRIVVELRCCVSLCS